jgi:hypothetical protein
VNIHMWLDVVQESLCTRDGQDYVKALAFLYKSYDKCNPSRKSQKTWGLISPQKHYSEPCKWRKIGMLRERKPQCQYWVLSEKLDDIGAQLEHLTCKPLKHLAQETGVSKWTMRTAKII